jgi:hypothetical protein
MAALLVSARDRAKERTSMAKERKFPARGRVWPPSPWNRMPRPMRRSSVRE